MADRLRFAVPWSVLVLVLPAVLKLFFLQVDKVFEPHTMAVEWLASGEFRNHYLGQWDHAFQFPVYTAIVAALYAIGLGPLAVLVFQVLCGALAAWCIGQVALLVLEGRAYAGTVSLVTVLLTGLSPFLAYYQVRMIHPFAWDMLLATAVLCAALRAKPEHRRWLLVLCALTGLAMLNRPTLAVFALPFILREWRFLFSMRAFGSKVLLAMLVCSPIVVWSVRNKVVTGSYQLTSVTDQMLWMGIQEETEGSGHLPNGDSYFHLLSMPECERLFQLLPQERSQFFAAKRKAELEADPGLGLAMFAVKERNFWLFRSHFGADQNDAVALWAMRAFRVYAVVVLALVVVALAIADRKVLPVFLSVMCLSIIQCSFYFETRHRLLAEPMLMLIALAGLAELIRRRKIGRSVR